MKIIPVAECGSGRQGHLVDISVDEINEILGFQPNCEDDPDKVVNSWGFTVAGKHYGVWDYEGSHEYGQFSVSGEPKVLRELFGDRYENYR